MRGLGNKFLSLAQFIIRMDMEELLHYVWKHRLFPLGALTTTEGQLVEVIDVGLQNTDAGPDFFNAKLRIDDTLWVGNVEVHVHASDWERHGHADNEAYDTVILHVVEEADYVVTRADGSRIPQLVLSCPDTVRARYAELQRTDRYPRCHAVIPTLSGLTVHAWMAALQTERLEQKARQATDRLKRCDGNWEDAFFVTLARNFGFGLNGDAFERWAGSIPFRAVDKHRDDLLQTEAFFFGQAGLLEGDELADEYYARLQQEYQYLRHMFALQPIDATAWRFLRLRPDNFPHVRIAQLAGLYHRKRALLSCAAEAQTLPELKELFRTQVSSYWETHYRFGVASPRRAKHLSDSSLSLIVINTVVPFLYAYGQFKADERMQACALRYLEAIKPENNQIIRLWQELGLKVESAADSQALIQLKKEYCDRRKCLQCRFGYAYLKQGGVWGRS